MAFRYQAIDASGNTLADVVNAASLDEAAGILRERGLLVTSLDRAAEQETGGAESAGGPVGKGARFKDVLLFTQQMSMLLRSGAQVVGALEAVEEQTSRLQWKRVVRHIRSEVQNGHSISTAMSRFPDLFRGVYVSMVAAGEASGELGVAFDRLSRLTIQQNEIRNRVYGAMSYPLILLCLCMGVMTVMLGFVLPRFAEMFEGLGMPLPWTTSMLIGASRSVRNHWLLLLISVITAGTGMFMFFGSSTGRKVIAKAILRIPLIGGLIRNIILARLCRVLGQLLESKVDLLEAVQLVMQGTGNPEFRDLMRRIGQAITEGKRIGLEMKDSWLVPKTYAGAIAMGEESGRLADSLLFVASSLDDYNSQALGSLTRILEPVMLAVMGLVVGFMAFSLFLPMFEMASNAGK